MKLIYRVHLWLFGLLSFIFLICLFVGKGVGFRLERDKYFFLFAFSFKVVFVLSTKTGSKPDCYAGLKNKCQ